MLSYPDGWPRVYNWHRPETAGVPMSIVIAAVAKDKIIIGADTLCMNGDEKAHYCKRHSKLYTASNPQFAIGLAGSKGAERFLSQRADWSSLDFDETVEQYKDSTFQYYAKGNTSYDFYYLVCGYDRYGKPRLSRVRFERDPCQGGKPVSDIEEVEPTHAIGIERHGAWYVLANYYRPEMSHVDASLFVYLCLKEVIRHDNWTRGPIEMMVVSPSADVSLVPNSDLEQLEKETNKRLSSVESIFTASFSFS